MLGLQGFDSLISILGAFFSPLISVPFGYDTLIGFAGNDSLDGGSGNDSLIGGLGNDIYVVDSVNDIITEELNAGTDTVKSGVSWTNGDNLEKGATRICGVRQY